MDDLTSSELVDSPELHISIHALYSCCLDTLKSISAVESQDESFKTYHARLKIWGAGLFTEGPSLNKILEEEPERYRPLLTALQKTLFSIAVEEGRFSLLETPHISVDLAVVVFLESRRALNGNHDIDLQLEPQTKTLLTLVSQNDTAVLACERRLPQLVNTLKISTFERLILQSNSSQNIRPSGSTQRMAREDKSSKSQGARRGLINRISKRFPATNEVISLFTKRADTVGRVRAASPLLGEQGLTEDENASLSQPSEAYHEDYDMYLGDLVGSLFDLLPSIRGIRRTALLEIESQQSNEKKQLSPPPYSDTHFSSYTKKNLVSFSKDIFVPRLLASQLYVDYFGAVDAEDVAYLRLGKGISALGASLGWLESIMMKAEEQIPENLRRLDASSTTGTIVKMLLEVTGDFNQTLLDCEDFLSNKLTYKRLATGIVKNVLWLGSTKTAANDLRQRVKFHVIKILLSVKPFELYLHRGIHGELQQARNDVAPLEGIYIQNTAQSIHPKRPKSRDVRLTVPPDLAKRFEVQVPDPLPLRGGFDAAIFHLANSTVEFEPSSGPGQNIPEETRFINLLKSAWIMEKLKDSDYLQSAGPESLWADCIRELEDKISAQVSRFDTDFPIIAFLYGLRGTLASTCRDCRAKALEQKILELTLPSPYDNWRSALTIFRKSDIAFRLVSTTKDERNPDYNLEKNVDIKMDFTRFIPAFAKPDNGEPINNKVLLCNSQGQDRMCHTFQDSSAIAEFQLALLGYRVLNYTSNISWSIGFGKSGQKAISGKARLQLWQLKPLPNLLPSLDSKALVGSGSSIGGSVRCPRFSKSPLSRSGSSVRRSIRSPLSSLPLSDSTTATSMTGSRGDGIALARPEPPVLVIFTMCENKYTFFHIKIERSVSAKPETCVTCLLQNKTCSQVLIKSSSSMEWNFRRLSAQADNEHGLDSWDLACFRHPEHPALHNLEQVTTVKYMSLHFETTDESEVFRTEFESLVKLRDTETLNYDRMTYKARPNYRPYSWLGGQ